MSNTAHQREMQDLKAAGLNPLLAANKGASTPSGGQAHQSNPADGLLSAAVQTTANRNLKKLQQAQIGDAEAGVGLKNAQKGLTNEDAKLKAVQAQEATARTLKNSIEAKVAAKDLKYYEAKELGKVISNVIPSLRGIVKPKSSGKIQNKFNPKTGEVEQWLK